MGNQSRMSPLTALFLGISAVLVTCIAAATGVALFGLSIVDHKADQVFGVADLTVEGIPKIIDSLTEGMPDLLKSLPPVIADAVHDVRAPEYAANLEIIADLRPAGHDGRLRPVLTITNQGDKLVTLLCVRAAALDESGTPWYEWTEVVATPLAFDNCWRGPLMPGSTRHVVMSGYRSIRREGASNLRTVCEISDVRVWNSPGTETVALADSD